MGAALAERGQDLAAAAAAGDPQTWETVAVEVAELAALLRLTARSAQPPPAAGQGALFDQDDGQRRES